MGMNRTTKLKLDKYGISSKRYKELCGFCEQYPDWKRELKDHSFIGSPSNIGEARSANKGLSDPTFASAVKLEKCAHNCNLIEEVAKETDPVCWLFLIKGICYEVPVEYLMSVEGMPISRSTFFYRRRYFFYLLDKKKG
jgi:hypothetical protein